MLRRRCKFDIEGVVGVGSAVVLIANFSPKGAVVRALEGEATKVLEFVVSF
jgi:hypothetical protein